MNLSRLQRFFRRNHTPRPTSPSPARIHEWNEEFLDSAELLKEATRLKQERQYDSAIEALRRAYRQMEREPVDYPIAIYLRLPMMLQLAGRSDEAWQEYNRLLLEDVTGRGLDSPVRPMELAQIYDKMRLFLQRENRQIEAVPMAALSYFCWGWGLKAQRRGRELRKHVTRKAITEALAGPLARAGLHDRLLGVARTVQEHLNCLPQVDMHRLAHKIADALANPNASGDNPSFPAAAIDNDA